MDSRSVSAWMGISFELVCLAKTSGFQIDMIIERADRIIHLCEMKFSTDRYAITDNCEMELRERMEYSFLTCSSFIQ